MDPNKYSVDCISLLIVPEYPRPARPPAAQLAVGLHGDLM